jgi:predicted DNA binding protein
MAMREFVFTLEFDPETNPVADILAAHSETRLRSLSCHVTAETLWRVDHVTGSEAALDAVVEAVTTADYYADCLVRRDCEGEWETRTLDRSDETLILYSYWNRTPACTSIPHLAIEHFGDGLIFETTWRGRQYQWRLILPGDVTLSEFHEALDAEIADTGGVDIVRVRDTGADELGVSDPDSETVLSPEQEQALRAAVKHGYYETPRAIETYELAETLGIPGSTLSYRLRRAEAKLAATHVQNLPLSSLQDVNH